MSAQIQTIVTRIASSNITIAKPPKIVNGQKMLAASFAEPIGWNCSAASLARQADNAANDEPERPGNQNSKRRALRRVW